MAVYGKRKIVLLLIMSKKRENTSFRLRSEKCETKIKEMIFLEWIEMSAFLGCFKDAPLWFWPRGLVGYEDFITDFVESFAVKYIQQTNRESILKQE